MPGIADNPLVRAARFIERIADLKQPPRLIPETEPLFAVLGDVPEPEELERVVAGLPQDVRETVEPLLGFALSPTMITASERINVIPSVVEVVCDCRLLPGDTPKDVEPAIRAALGEDSYELEWIEAVGGSRSPLGTPLWQAIEAFVAEYDPGAGVLPVVSPGFTDSHFLRQSFGTVAYGFFPMRTMDTDLAARLIHSADERIAVEDLELGVRFLRHVAATLGG